MKRLLTIISASFIVFMGCNREPYADAVISPNPAYVGEDVYFQDLSVNTESVEWDFDDGYKSTAFNPVHYYVHPGYYDVIQKAFGKKAGLDIMIYELRIIGSSVKIEVRDVVDNVLIPGASILLYPTLQDWDDQRNASEDYWTNNYGICTIEGLSYQRYYVDVWVNEGYNNWGLGLESVDWIETQMLAGGYDNTFIAYVDFYDTGKKSASRTRPENIKAGPKDAASSDLLRDNKISVPKK